MERVLQRCKLEKLKLLSEFEKKSPIKCGTFDANAGTEQRYLACGDFDGNIKLYDLERGPGVNNEVWSCPQAHDGIINAIDGAGSRRGPPEIVTAGRDGCVRIWDTRQKYKEVTSLVPAAGEKIVDCWAVAFGNSVSSTDRTVACGYENGDLKMLDMRMNELHYETNTKNGICSLQFDDKYGGMDKLIATHLEGRFSIFDLKTLHPEEGYATLMERLGKKTQSTVWCGSWLPQNKNLFMVASGGGQLNLCRYKHPKQRSVIKSSDDGTKLPMGVMGKVEMLQNSVVSTQPICSFDWHRDKLGLAVMGSFDQALRVVIVTKLEQM